MTKYIQQFISAIAFASIALCATISFAQDKEKKAGDAKPIAAPESSDLKKAAADFQKRYDSDPGLSKKVADAVQSKDNAALTSLVGPPSGSSVQGVVLSDGPAELQLKICWTTKKGVEWCITIVRSKKPLLPQK